MSMRTRKSNDKPTKQKIAEALAAASRRRRQAQQPSPIPVTSPIPVPAPAPAPEDPTTGTGTNTTPTGTNNTPTGTTTATTTATTTDAKLRLRDRDRQQAKSNAAGSIRAKKNTPSGRKRQSKVNGGGSAVKPSKRQESSAGADVKDSERGADANPLAADSPANLKIVTASLRARKKKSKDKKERAKKGHTDGSEKKLRDTPSKRNPKSPVTKSLMQAATPKNEDEIAASSENHKDDEVVDKKSLFEAKPVYVDGRTAFVKTVYTKRLRGVVKEFQKSRDYLPPTSATAYTANENKNRYADVLCMDETRVVLKGRRPDNDYIHASWLTCPVPGSQKYICAQGPLDETVVDFWQMVFQERVPAIVMLCGIIENGYEKCAQYWPPTVGETVRHGKFVIKNEKSEITDMESIRVTTLTVENLDFRKAHDRAEADLTVVHYHWGDWPDHVSPSDPSPATELLKWIKEKANGAPIVVHCSAGIGRTGTFCGIDYANDKLRTSTAVKMPEIINEMRRQRVHSVQSNPQYAYIHMCLLHMWLEQKVIAESDDSKAFYNDYKRYVEAVKRNVEKKHARSKEREKAAEKERLEKEKDKGGAVDKEKVAPEKESDRERPAPPES